MTLRKIVACSGVAVAVTLSGCGANTAVVPLDSDKRNEYRVPDTRSIVAYPSEWNLLEDEDVVATAVFSREPVDRKILGTGLNVGRCYVVFTDKGGTDVTEQALSSTDTDLVEAGSEKVTLGGKNFWMYEYTQNARYWFTYSTPSKDGRVFQFQTILNPDDDCQNQIKQILASSLL